MCRGKCIGEVTIKQGSQLKSLKQKSAEKSNKAAKKTKKKKKKSVKFTKVKGQMVDNLN